MNQLFERLMHQAARLTQGGNLEEATRAIQRALNGSPPEAPGGGPAETEHSPAHPAHAANDDRLVIDAEARFVEAPPVTREAPSEHEVVPELGEDQWTDGLFAHRNRSLAYKLFVPAKGTGTVRPLV